MSGRGVPRTGERVFGMEEFDGKAAEPGAASGGTGPAAGEPAAAAGRSVPGRRRRGRHEASGSARARVVALVVAVAAVTAAGGAYALTHGGSGSQAAGVQGAALAGQATSTPLRVIAISPASGARGVDGGNPVVITFSAPLAAGSPMPTLTPAVPGSWQRPARR